MPGHTILGYVCKFISNFWKLSSFWQASFLSPEELASTASRIFTAWLLVLAVICINISCLIGFTFSKTRGGRQLKIKSRKCFSKKCPVKRRLCFSSGENIIILIQENTIWEWVQVLIWIYRGFSFPEGPYFLRELGFSWPRIPCLLPAPIMSGLLPFFFLKSGFTLYLKRRQHSLIKSHTCTQEI